MCRKSVCLGGDQASSCGPQHLVLCRESAPHPFGTFIAPLHPTYTILVAGLAEAIVFFPQQSLVRKAPVCVELNGLHTGNALAQVEAEF